MGKRASVMVVDDDYNIQALVKRVLELEGYEVIQATNGNLALALLEERRPDLVILDVMMPGLNGFQVLFLIKKRYNIPVIIVTAMSEVSSYSDTSSNTFCSFPHYYFICLRKACQTAKVSINLSPESVPLLLTIYIAIDRNPIVAKPVGSPTDFFPSLRRR